MSNGIRPSLELFCSVTARLVLSSGCTRREIADDQGIGLLALMRCVRHDRDATDS